MFQRATAAFKELSNDWVPPLVYKILENLCNSERLVAKNERPQRTAVSHLGWATTLSRQSRTKE